MTYREEFYYSEDVRRLTALLHRMANEPVAVDGAVVSIPMPDNAVVRFDPGEAADGKQAEALWFLDMRWVGIGFLEPIAKKAIDKLAEFFQVSYEGGGTGFHLIEGGDDND